MISIVARYPLFPYSVLLVGWTLSLASATYTSETAAGAAARSAQNGVGESLTDSLGEVQLEKELMQVSDSAEQAAFEHAMLGFAMLQAQSGIVTEEIKDIDLDHDSNKNKVPRVESGVVDPTAYDTASASSRSFGEARPENQHQSQGTIDKALLVQQPLRGHMGGKQMSTDHERLAPRPRGGAATDHSSAASSRARDVNLQAKMPDSAVEVQDESHKVDLGVVRRQHHKASDIADAAAASIAHGAALGTSKAHSQEVGLVNRPKAAATMSHLGSEHEAHEQQTETEDVHQASSAGQSPSVALGLARPSESPARVGNEVAKAESLQSSQPAPKPEAHALGPQLQASRAPEAVDNHAKPEQSVEELLRDAALEDAALVVAADRGSVASIFKTRNRFAVGLLVFVAVVSIFGNACFAAGMCLSTALWKRKKLSAMRRQMENLPVCRVREIDQRLPAAGGYDCTFTKPVRSKMLLRIEAKVLRPTSGSQLMAPLTKKTCVLYSSAVSRKLHEGMSPVPVAFSFDSVNFSVSLLDSPATVIEVKGGDVTLFDMCEGRHVERRHFNRVPDDWQDFISSHRTSPHLSSTLRYDDAVLEFQECTLCVGAMVTLVGELIRNPNGMLSLRPWSEKDEAARNRPQRESWRTSWEDWSCVNPSTIANDAANTLADAYVESVDEVAGERDLENAESAEDEGKVQIEKVLISDNPELYRKGSPAACCDGGLCCGSWPRRWPLGGACASARTLLGKDKGDNKSK